MASRFDGGVAAAAAETSTSHLNGVVFGSYRPPRQPNYTHHRVQEALEHLASIDLIDLCNEAKVECCRATRDLRSCARYVENVLNSCGHASLCTECCQRFDVCPICRTPIPKNGDRTRLRLYYECIEAGLISKKHDDRFQDTEDGDSQIAADVERLYSLFDVAVENSLVSLICHYVTDVCLDESAVSSDPVTAILLDEVVVKDWCKSRFHNILKELQGLYNNHSVREMESSLSSLLKFSVKLAGLTNVVDVLDSSFKGTLSAQLHDLHYLQECILKTKQHLEVMVWCIRHQFLEGIRARFPDSDITSWRASVRERKSAAIRRSWPDSVSPSAESTGATGSTLFIEDALANIEAEEGYLHKMGGELEIASLQKDGSSSSFKSKIEGMGGCYPFENLRAAVDILFLRGSSDLVVAKQAIFLYYLFDRHWTRIEEDWRHIIDDFAATFNITRHSLLESLTFYLLDDHTEEALQEACGLLPEISGPTTHPKVAQVLLERQNPDAALMVLRWSGRDAATELISLGEAVTAVRVRVECGLLTEAFMYQRALCLKTKEKKSKYGSSQHSDDLKDESKSWLDWVEALVTEICFLCIRRNLVDRMIELPWDSIEEKYLHKCLLDFAIDNPSCTVGSLLLVFYLQRYRYAEAYQVDGKLQQAEQVFISENDVSEEVLNRMQSASHWRSGLVEKSVELLPEIQQAAAKSGKLPETAISLSDDAEIPAISDRIRAQESSSSGLLVPPAIPVILQMNGPNTSSPPFVGKTSSKLNGFASTYNFTHGTPSSASVLNGSFFTNGTTEKPQTTASKFKFEDLRTSGIRHVTPMKAIVLRDFNRSTLRKPQGSSSRDHRFEEVSPTKEENGFSCWLPSQNLYSVGPPSDGPYMPKKVAPSDDQMVVSWSHGEKDSAEGAKVGPRWRSDDASEDEELQSPNIFRAQISRRSRLSTRR